ncbi:MAG: tetratricopeptide repeat protein [Candidatus Obscuribacterales bacterium]|nr:tetratricopeptide repeat protein [Candidatus Obscuribacterales bacterium]
MIRLFLALFVAFFSGPLAVLAEPAPLKLEGRVDMVAASCAEAGITLSSENLPSLITKVGVDSPAAKANLAAEDKLISAEVKEGRITVIIERKGQKFATRIYTDPEATPKTSQENDKKIMPVDDAVYDELTDFWLGQYAKSSQPSGDKVAQEKIMKRIEERRGLGHLAAYYPVGPYKNNFLLSQGVRLYAVGDRRNAERLFKAAAELQPNNPDAYYDLGVVFEDRKELRQAAKYYKRALRYSPYDRGFRYAQATVGRLKGSCQECAFGHELKMNGWYHYHRNATGFGIADGGEQRRLSRSRYGP